MAQNSWLEMFDKRMSELHQLDYLRQQMSEAQAARQQRAYEFGKGLEENALDRGLAKQRLALDEENAENRLQGIWADLFNKGYVEAQPGEKADVEFGGRGFNPPHPLFAATQKAQFEKMQRDQELQDIQAMGKTFGIPIVKMAPYIMSIMGGKPFSDTNPSEMLAEQLAILNDDTASPEDKAAAEAFINIYKTRAQRTTTAGSRPTSWQHTAKMEQAEYALRAELAKIVGTNTTAPDYSGKVLANLSAIVAALKAQGMDPALVEQAAARVMRNPQNQRSDPNALNTAIVDRMMGR